MLDINWLKQNKKEAISRLNTRQEDYSAVIALILDAHEKWQISLSELEMLLAKRNILNKELALKFKQKTVSEADKKQIENLKHEISELQPIVSNYASQWKKLLLTVPNIPSSETPIGKNEEENVILRKSELIPESNPKALAHWQIAHQLKLVDFTLAAKLSGSRFATYTGKGAKLLRAIQNFLLDKAEQNGYTEILPPVIANGEALTNTGQLPKFKDDMYELDVDKNKSYLISTAEIPLVNTVANKLLNISDLPQYYCAYTNCFRQEAGAAGKDTRGLIRMHEFHKVELVRICDENNSEAELRMLLNHVSGILEDLKIPYQILQLCTGDLGFSAAKTFDFEVWMPYQNKYREISSCSNCTNFQARRMKARYRDKNNKIVYVHTLNGSALALDRLFAAILENYYDQEKNILLIPEALHKYLGFTEIK